MPKTRILITVKTHPTLSTTYGELVCTAGIKEDGSWVRLYPVPFRRLSDKEQYKKYDWVECDIQKQEKDSRPESYLPKDYTQLVEKGHLGTNDKWLGRRKLILEVATVHKQMNKLITGAHENTLSLAVFKPTKVIGFSWREVEREWDSDKLERMRNEMLQGELFPEEGWRKEFKPVRKLPYNFYYKFEDSNGKTSEFMILDWEIGALYWNCLTKYGDEAKALEKVREKYVDDFCNKDLHFFLGTTQRWHSTGPNPWLIIGVFPIPHETQLFLI